MSVVLSEFFNHDDGHGVEHLLKSSAVDDRFHLYMMKHSRNSGFCSDIHMDFSVDEAKVLKKQLEEFISNNT